MEILEKFRVTISAKFPNPGISGILRIPGVRAVSQFLLCLKSPQEKFLVVTIEKLFKF